MNVWHRPVMFNVRWETGRILLVYSMPNLPCRHRIHRHYPSACRNRRLKVGWRQEGHPVVKRCSYKQSWLSILENRLTRACAEKHDVKTVMMIISMSVTDIYNLILQYYQSLWSNYSNYLNKAVWWNRPQWTKVSNRKLKPLMWSWNTLITFSGVMLDINIPIQSQRRLLFQNLKGHDWASTNQTQTITHYKN